MPKLASKVIGWLDVKEDDVILDVGCGGEWRLAHVQFCTSYEIASMYHALSHCLDTQKYVEVKYTLTDSQNQMGS